MNRILWWSNAPWCNTGFGQQTATFTPLLRDLGHEVAIGAFYGLHGAPLEWDGIPVYPGGRDGYGIDMIGGHYAHWKADLLITLMDTWVINPEAIRDLNAACWTPVDCSPLGADKEVLEDSGAVPIAVSRHGERMLGEAGLKPLYVPHGVDTGVFSPPADRRELRREMGLGSKFVIGINAANKDHNRKGFSEQLRAFAAFRRKHKDAVLLVHTVAENDGFGGLNLRKLAARFGIADQVVFCSQYDYLAGLTPPAALARWYGALDVFSNCAFGEGFGIPIIEAQACGTPVVVTRASAMTELCGPGWLVTGEPYHHEMHEADWAKPRIFEITRAYGQAYLDAGNRRKQAREFALKYDAKNVLETYWRPVLDGLHSQ